MSEPTIRDIFALRRSVQSAILTYLTAISDPDRMFYGQWSDHARVFSGPWVNDVIREECERAEEILRAGWSPSGKHQRKRGRRA